MQQRGFSLFLIIVIFLILTLGGSYLIIRNYRTDVDELNSLQKEKVICHPKIESVVCQFMENPSNTKLIKENNIRYKEGLVTVVLELHDPEYTLPQNLGTEDFRDSTGNLLQVKIYPENLKEVADDPRVRNVRLPLRVVELD